MASISPRTLKGFRDFLGEDMEIRKTVIQTFIEVFESYGYEPLETPTLEYADILLGKYGEEAEKLIYQFKDRGDRAVAMKYDLTVPTCRVLAQYSDKIPLPYKRYQIQPVWRADNTQKGRFREFFQCDADTLGSSSMLADAEFIQMGLSIMKKLGFTDYVAKINNRKFIDGLTQYAGADASQFYAVCVAVDKLEKIGIDKVVAEMKSKGVSDHVIEKIVSVISLKGSPFDLIETLMNLMKGVEQAQSGLAELKTLFSYLKQSGVNENEVEFDLSIIRGLSYYTGPVWEFVVKDGGVGSVAGCGRYDKLVGLYSGKDIPATGGSFGIERIIEIVKERRLLKGKQTSTVLVTVFSPDSVNEAIKTASFLRKNGISALLYPEEEAKLEKQLKYADRKKIRYVIIAGPEEIAQNMIKLKDLVIKEQRAIKKEELIQYLKSQISNVK